MPYNPTAAAKIRRHRNVDLLRDASEIAVDKLTIDQLNFASFVFEQSRQFRDIVNRRIALIASMAAQNVVESVVDPVVASATTNRPNRSRVKVVDSNIDDNRDMSFVSVTSVVDQPSA